MEAIMNYEQQYIDMLQCLVDKASRVDTKDDRTGTGTFSLFGPQISVDLTQEFPLLQTKKVHMPSIIHELLWFISGSTNIQYLTDNKVKIWNEWANAEGELGPVYGKQWRSWPSSTQVHSDTEETYGIDQLMNMIDQLRATPDSRRIIVSAWNPDVLPVDSLSPEDNATAGRMALAPCHTLFQAYTEVMTPMERIAQLPQDHADELFSKVPLDQWSDLLDECGVPSRYLDMKMYQRSADWFLGVPFNTPSYALLMLLLGNLVNMVPRRFIHTFGDAHLYSNHIEQAQEQINRYYAKPPEPNKVKVGLRKNNYLSIDDFKYADISVKDYNPMSAIKAPIAK